MSAAGRTLFNRTVFPQLGWDNCTKCSEVGELETRNCHTYGHSLSQIKTCPIKLRQLLNNTIVSAYDEKKPINQSNHDLMNRHNQDTSIRRQHICVHASAHETRVCAVRHAHDIDA